MKQEVSVFFHSLFLENTGVQVKDVYFCDDGATVLDLIELICRGNENLMFKLIDEQGKLRAHINIFVGSDNCRYLDGLDSQIEAGKTVSIFPALSGG